MRLNKKLLVLTSVIILLPLILGSIFWSQLPDTIATHFNISGQANGFSSKYYAVFALPSLLLLVHFFCLFMVFQSPKGKNIGSKVIHLVYWLVPLISIIMMLGVSLPILKISFKPTLFIGLSTGILFLVIGNYLPKIKQNYVVGIRLPWTLADEDNWNKTHRLAGKIWVLGSLAILLDSFMQFAFAYVFGACLVIMIIIPCVYSFWLSQKEGKD